MLEISTFLKEKPLPEFIKDHPSLKEIKKVNKIFPSLGLPNFTSATDLKNSDIRNISSTLIYKITYLIADAEYFLSRKIIENATITRLCRNTIDAINQSHSIMLNEQENGGKLCLSCDINDFSGKVFLPVGTSIFKMYSRLAEILIKDYNYLLTALDQIEEFKNYSTNNISGKMQIVFSSEGMDGAWDLATMSTRGIKSCQSWDGQFKECLIGSITDPYVGIIYTTTGSKLPDGTRMVRRCIVRFIVDKETNEHFIFLDKMYPALDTATLTAFRNTLTKHLPVKIKIIDYYQSHNFANYFIPSNPWTDLLLKYRKDKSGTDYNLNGAHNQHNILSYRDTLIEFKKKPSILEALQRAKNLKISAFRSSCYTFISGSTHLSYEYASLLEKLACKYIFEPIILDETMFPSTILRKSCIAYFRSSKKIMGQISKEIAEHRKKGRNKSPLLEGVKYLITGEPDNKIVLNEFIENNFKDFISSYMMDLWNSSIQKPKPKRKARKTATK